MNRSRICAIAVTAAALSIPTAVSPAFAGTPASADSQGVTITYSCTEPPYPAGEADFNVFIKVPKKVFRGDTINVKAALQSVDASKIDVPAGGVTGSLGINVGGALTTTVTATGLANQEAVPIGQQVLQSGGTASLTASTTGVYTFAPGQFVLSTWMGTVLDCAPASSPVAATTTVLPRY